MLHTYLPMAVKTLKMLLFLGTELSVLFLAICFLVTLVQQYLPQSKIEKLLGGKKSLGYILAIGLGVLTPFCSCSTIPLLKGLLKAKTGFGQMMTFLFVSPLLNPIIMGLFLITFGLKSTAVYVSIALTVAVTASILLNVFGFEKFIISHPQKAKTCSCQTTVSSRNCCAAKQTAACYSIPQKSSSCCETENAQPSVFHTRVRVAFKDALQQFKEVLPYLLLGITIGAFIYGFLPTELIAKYAGNDNIFAVPTAAIIGIPLYIRMEAVIPLAGLLAAKGMGLGAIMALIIGSSGASVTEVILLKSMFKWPLVTAFVGVVFSMAVLTGYLFQYVIAA